MSMKTQQPTVPQIFEHEQFGQFCFVMLKDDPWFMAVDVCRVLGLTNPTVAVAALDNDERAKFNLGHPYGETRGCW